MTAPVPFSRLIAYLRKSRDDGEDSVEEVLARHERILQDWCVRTYSAPLPEDRIFREVGSGETIDSRPVVQEVLGLVRDKSVDGVLVVELQRLSRGDFSDIGRLEQAFLYTGCRIVTPTRSLSLADEYDRQYFEMELLHGREYLSYVKRILRRGVEQSSREGNYVSAVPPYGYRRTRIGKKPTLEPDPEEAEVVRMIFDWYAGEGVGGTVIADRLNALGRLPRDGAPWTTHKLRHILENPVYTGMIRWGYIRHEKEFRDGEVVSVKKRHRDESVILVPGKHPAIIDPELFRQAREAAEARRNPAKKKSSGDLRNPLAGLLRCGECGHVMTAVPTYHYGTRDLIDYAVRCTYTRGCPTRGAYLREILGVLRDTLSASLRDLEVDGADPEARSPAPDERRICAAELEDLDRQQERLYGFLERGTYSEEVFRERSARIARRREELTEILARLDERQHDETRAAELRANLGAVLALLDDPSTPASSLNRALKKVIRNIIYTRENGSRKDPPTPIRLRVELM